MNTTENNKLIAEFMSDLPQWKLAYIKDENYPFYINPWSSKANTYDENMNLNGFNLVPTCNFNFHTDWNWLMEVVKKIESLGFEVTILKNECTIRDNGTIDFDFDRTYCVPTKIESVYNACVQFIKWYNLQNK